MPLPVDRRRALALLCSFVAAPFLAPRVGRAAEAWPTRTVRYVNGFPAGGATDTLSRILCQKMSELSGQSFVVENRAGAGGVLGERCGGEVAARRLHARPRRHRHQCAGDRHLRQIALLTRATVLPSSAACGSCRISSAPGRIWTFSDLKDLLASLQEGARQIHLRLGGIRHHAAPLRRDDEQHGRRAGEPHPLARGAEPGLDRSVGRPGRSAVRQPARLAAERARAARSGRSPSPRGSG